MNRLRTTSFVACAFVAGVFCSGQMASVSGQQKKQKLVHDTSPETILRVRKALTDSKWNLGNGDWQQFLSEMKTTNQLARTGNWVVTDEKTALTGGRGASGAVYIWKFDPTLKNASIYKYVRDPAYKRSAVRIGP